MKAWDRRDGESLADYIKRLEDFIRPDPPRARIADHDWVYRMRLREAKAQLRADKASANAPAIGSETH
jgi:hypothetical protein